MRLSATALALALLAALSASPQTAPPTTARIEGSIVRADTGEPLNRARITLQRISSRQGARLAVSGAAGNFTLENIPPGRYRLVVERQGYVRQSYGQRGPSSAGADLDIAPGQSLRGLIFRLLPHAVITGRAVDELGEPLENVRIEAHRRACVRGQSSWTRVRTSSTNDLGEYRLSGLAPGSYFLSAVSPSRLFPGDDSPADSADADEPPTLYGYAPVYHPDTSDPSRALPIELTAGAEHRNIDFNFSPVATVSVRGRLDVTSTPVRGASVLLLPSGAALRGLYLSNSARVREESGEFELRGVVPGTYILFATASARDQRLLAQFPLQVGNSDVIGIHIPMQPGATLSGRLRIEASLEPIPTRSYSVQLEPLEPLGRGVSSSPVNPAGEFRIRDLAPGAYRVRVGGVADTLYLRSALLGTENVLESTLRVAPAATLAALDIVLSPDGGSIEGLALSPDSLPAPGAVVTAIPDSPHYRHTSTKTVSTDQNGRFLFNGLAPGSYRLFAYAEAPPDVCLDLPDPSTTAPRGIAVSVSARQISRAEVRTLP